jgi:ubiquitin-protein ligase E3 A
LAFIVQRNGGDSNRLPTASTCFNILLLPQYESEERLRERLLKAVDECAGFGLK